MAKAKTDSKTAAVVLFDPALSAARPLLKKFQARTIDAIEQIARTDRDNTDRRVLVGAALILAKELLPHGEFMKWLKAHVTGAGYTQCTYFMRAAAEFMKSAQGKLTSADLVPLAGNAGMLTLAKKAQGTKLAGAVRGFVGEMTWTELLETYGIRDAKKVGGPRGTGDDGEPEAPDPEQLYLFSRDEIGGAITAAESLLLKENRLQHLAGHPEEIRGVVASLRALADKVEAAAQPLLKKSA